MLRLHPFDVEAWIAGKRQELIPSSKEELEYNKLSHSPLFLRTACVFFAHCVQIAASVFQADQSNLLQALVDYEKELKEQRLGPGLRHCS